MHAEYDVNPGDSDSTRIGIDPVAEELIIGLRIVALRRRRDGSLLVRVEVGHVERVFHRGAEGHRVELALLEAEEVDAVEEGVHPYVALVPARIRVTCIRVLHFGSGWIRLAVLTHELNLIAADRMHLEPSRALTFVRSSAPIRSFT